MEFSYLLAFFHKQKPPAVTDGTKTTTQITATMITAEKLEIKRPQSRTLLHL
jgi:hypothetical protein